MGNSKTSFRDSKGTKLVLRASKGGLKRNTKRISKMITRRNSKRLQMAGEAPAPAPAWPA